jgi:Restriction endonuclease
VSGDKSGRSLEQAVGRIQQLLDPNSRITYREKIPNRLGILREFDVVVRGEFAGHPMLGVIECKDWSEKVGTPEVDAFVTKTRDVNANLCLIVSPKGFTEPALRQAKDAGIGVFSLLPDDPDAAGFTLGILWYGLAYTWGERKYDVRFLGSGPKPGSYSTSDLLYNGAPILNVFEKELSTTHLSSDDQRSIELRAEFSPYLKVQVGSATYRILEIRARAERHLEKKKRLMLMTGDALYDWHTGKLKVPAAGSVSVHGFEPNLTGWDDYDGDIPETGLYQLVVHRYWGCIDLDIEQVPDIPRLKIEVRRG